MISVQAIVSEVLYKDEEALAALAEGYMNLSSYAKKIKETVEDRCKKNVGLPSIIMALSRLQKDLGKSNPLVKDIEINSITTKLPLTEIAYDKNLSLMKELKVLYEQSANNPDDFLSMTLSTGEITIICAEHLAMKILKKFKEKPKKIETGLAGISISFDQKYYNMPSVTFSLIRKFAVEKISIAETISTYTEVIFVFKKESLGKVIEMFSKNLTRNS